MKKEEMLDFHIRTVWQKIARLYNAEAVKYGLTMSSGFVLLNIDEENGTPSTKLGPKMGMEANSLTRILKSMESKGLIYREQDKEDKRMVRVFLTKKGKKGRVTAKENVHFFNHFFHDQIPSEKIVNFLEVMNLINDILDSQNIFAEKENLITK